MSDKTVDPRLARHYDITKHGGEEKHIRKFMSMIMIGNKDLLMPMVNVTAIFLSMSDKANAEAKNIYEKDLRSNISEVGEFYAFSSNVHTRIPDYIEQAFSATLFAYLAAEAFSNAIIPDDYIYNDDSDGKGDIVRDKKYIERNVSLKVKYKKIIPDIYKLSSLPSEQNSWSNFIELEKMRNEITHYKSEGPDDGENIASFLREFFVKFMQGKAVPSSRKLIAWVADQIPDHPSIPSEFHNYPFKNPGLDIVYPDSDK